MTEAATTDLRAMLQELTERACVGLPKHSQKHSTITSISSSIHDWAKRDERAGRSAADRFETAMEWLDKLLEAANPLAYAELDPARGAELRAQLSKHSALVKEPASCIWEYQSIRAALDNIEAKKDPWPIDMLVVSRCVSQYLRQPWATVSRIELAMVQMLAYAEIVALAQAFRGHGMIRNVIGGGASIAWSVAKSLAVVLLVALVGLSAMDQVGLWAGILAGTAMYAMIALMPRPTAKAREKQIALLADMAQVYQVTGHEPVSPLLLREMVVATTTKGAVWPAGMFELIEHAYRRRSDLWA